MTVLINKKGNSEGAVKAYKAVVRWACEMLGLNQVEVYFVPIRIYGAL